MKISCKFSEFDYKRRTEELASEPQSTFPAPLFQTHTGKETQTRRRKHTKVLNNVSLPKSKKYYVKRNLPSVGGKIKIISRESFQFARRR